VFSSSGHLNSTTEFLKSINQETLDPEFPPVIEKGFLERSWEEGSEGSVLLDMGSQDDLEALSTDAIVHVGEIKSRGEAWGTTEKGPSPDVNGRPTSRVSARPRPSITGLSSARQSDGFQNISGNLFRHGWNVLVIYCWAVLLYLFIICMFTLFTYVLLTGLYW
jgi:hypothetical protein